MQIPYSRPQQAALVCASRRITVRRETNITAWAWPNGTPLNDHERQRGDLLWIITHATNLNDVSRPLWRNVGPRGTLWLRRHTVGKIATAYPEYQSACYRLLDELGEDTIVDEVVDLVALAPVADPVADPFGAAVDALNARLIAQGDRPRHRASFSVESRCRMAVNWLRHSASNYEQCLAAINAQLGPGFEAPIRVRVYELIADAYPELGAECARQLDERLPEPAGV